MRNNLHAWYDPNSGRWISEDPFGFAAGDANLYRYVGNEVTEFVDPTGEGKARFIGWVAQRTGTKLIRGGKIFTERQAAKLFLNGHDVIVKGGRSVAKSVALKAIPKDDLLRHAGHLLRDGSRGLRHFQSDKIPNRHIFYSALTATILAAVDADAGTCDAAVSLDALYTNEYPDPSIANTLTVSYRAPNTRWEYVDWINPLEILAIAGDFGKSIDRELTKDFIGITVILKKDNSPHITYTLDANGKLVSVTTWADGQLGDPISGEDFLKSIAIGDRANAIQEIIDLAKPLVEMHGQ